MTDTALKNQTTAILYSLILYIQAPLTPESDNWVNKGNKAKEKS